MLSWDRHHRNNEAEWPIRPDGFFNTGGIEGCCLLLLQDDGSGTSEFLLLLDVDETSCLELLNCPENECCLLLLQDDGSGTSELLLLDAADCLGLLNCVE